jgi:PBP1b-binding outer membrane lipoprotein LpoB
MQLPANVWGARRSSFVRARPSGRLDTSEATRQHRSASPTVHCGRSDNHSVIQRQLSAANDATTDTREASISGTRQTRHTDY